MREPFLRVWVYMEKGAPVIHTYHSLFKFPAEAEDEMGEYRGEFGYFGDRNEEGEETQLFKPAQDNSYKWKKQKSPTTREHLHRTTQTRKTRMSGGQ